VSLPSFSAALGGGAFAVAGPVDIGCVAVETLPSDAGRPCDDWPCDCDGDGACCALGGATCCVVAPWFTTTTGGGCTCGWPTPGMSISAVASSSSSGLGCGGRGGACNACCCACCA